jgi:hypothetical protein
MQRFARVRSPFDFAPMKRRTQRAQRPLARPTQTGAERSAGAVSRPRAVSDSLSLGRPRDACASPAWLCLDVDWRRDRTAMTRVTRISADRSGPRRPGGPPPTARALKWYGPGTLRHQGVRVVDRENRGTTVTRPRTRSRGQSRWSDLVQRPRAAHGLPRPLHKTTDLPVAGRWRYRAGSDPRPPASSIQSAFLQ